MASKRGRLLGLPREVLRTYIVICAKKVNRKKSAEVIVGRNTEGLNNVYKLANVN